MANARVYTFTTINFPGVPITNTYLEGINNSGTIVGTYNDVTGSHGFLYAGESFTTIDFPDVAYTWGYGINNSSDIVGAYADGALVYHGFLYAGGSLTPIDFPGGAETSPLGVNDFGTIVGYYRDAAYGPITHGFLYAGGSLITVDFPGASKTLLGGINNSGTMVGWYLDAIGAHGFLYAGGSFTTIDFPGASHTYAYGINNSGTIVGRYQDGTGIHGFLYAGGSFTTIDFPGASNTYACGINDSGNIVGYYDDVTGLHGFLASPWTTSTDPTYEWHTFYGSGNYDFSYNSITTDRSGNVYVTGYSLATWDGPAGQSPLHAHSGNNDAFVLKLDSNDSYLWHTFYGSTIGSNIGEGITTDGSGNVYLTGGSSHTWDGPAGESPLHAYSGGEDIFVLKLDSNGSYLWHTFYGSTTRSDMGSGYGIIADGSGNVYILGYGSGTWDGPAGQSPLHAYSGNNDVFVLKLDSNGAYKWHTFYGGPNDTDEGYAVAIDGSGSVYVTGGSSGNWYGPSGQNPLHAHSAGNYYDVFVLKLDSNGSYLWHTFYGSTIGSDIGGGIASDSSGGVYISGFSSATWSGPAGQNPLHAHSSPGYYDIFVLKLDTSGTYQWHSFYGSSGYDYGLSIGTDGSGNVYISGYGSGTWDGPAGQSPAHAYSGGADIFVLKLDSNGSYQWHTFYGSSYADLGWGIATDGRGNVYVTGFSTATWNGPAGQSPLHAHSSTGYYDVFVLKLVESFVCNEPFITSQPESQTIQSGQTVSMAVSVSGSTPLIYQWYQGASGDISSPISGATSSSYTTPALTQTATYWVRVANSCGSADSITVTITVSIAGISILSPNGGDNWAAGSTQTIRWTYYGNPGSYVKIELLKSGVVDRTIKSFALKGIAGNGSCNWAIPANQVPGTDYRIRVTSTTNGTYTDTSDSDFTIAAPTITVVSPNGGENWAAGSSQTISWSYTGTPRSYVKIELLKGDVFNRVITSSCLIGSGGSGSYAWIIPTSQAGGSDYQVRVTNTTNSACTDTTNSTFTITGPKITVTSPNGGENWAAGTTQTIQWTYTGNPGSYVRIELLKGGVLNRTIVSSISKGTNESGSYNWVVPSTQTAGSDYQVRVTSTSNSACTGTSNGNFTITGPPPPSITVTSPNGGETWAAGTTQTIRWSYTGSPGSYVKIELLKSGILTLVISSSCLIGSGGIGSYAWIIPTSQAGGSDYQVRVTSTTNSAYTDSSDSNFTIAGPPPPTISVVSPNGGESWAVGTKQTIRWSYSGSVGSSVKIELLKAGVVHRTITSSALGRGGSGSYDFSIPYNQAVGSDYRIRVTSTSNNSYSDTSDSNFTISK